MSYSGIGSSNMSRGFLPAPMAYRSEQQASASPYQAPTVGYRSEQQASIQAPQQRSTMTYATVARGVGFAMPLRTLTPAQPSGMTLVTTRSATLTPARRMSFADEKGRLSALQIVARPYLVALSQAALSPKLSLGEKAALSERLKTARSLAAMLAAVRPNPRGWIRSDIDKLRAINDSGVLPGPQELQLLVKSGNTQAQGFAAKILQAWTELRSSLVASGWWTLGAGTPSPPAGPPPVVRLPATRISKLLVPSPRPLTPSNVVHDSSSPGSPAEVELNPPPLPLPPPPTPDVPWVDDAYGPPGPGPQDSFMIDDTGFDLTQGNPPLLAAEEKKFPWLWVGLGVAAVGVGGYLLTRK